MPTIHSYPVRHNPQNQSPLQHLRFSLLWSSTALPFYGTDRPLTFNLTSVMLDPGNGNCNVTCLCMILLTAHGTSILSQICDLFTWPSDCKHKIVHDTITFRDTVPYHQTKIRQEPNASCRFLPWLSLWIWRRRRHRLKQWWTSSGLCSIRASNLNTHTPSADRAHAENLQSLLIQSVFSGL